MQEAWSGGESANLQILSSPVIFAPRKLIVTAQELDTLGISSILPKVP